MQHKINFFIQFKHLILFPWIYKHKEQWINKYKTIFKHYFIKELETESIMHYN